MSESQQIVRSHSLIAKIIHWGFIGVFIYALIKQIDDVEQLEDFSLLQFEMVFATIFLALLIARYLYMRFTLPTVLPSNTPKLKRLAARSVHIGMYVSLSMIAVTGLVIGGLYWSGTKDGLVMNIVIGMHEISVTASYLLIGLHIAASIYHRIKKDGIWASMVPFWKEKTSN